MAQKVAFCRVDHLLGRQRLAAAHGLDSPEKVGAAGHGLNMGKRVNDRWRTVFGNHAGGVAAFGKDGDGAHGKVFGRVGNGFADGFGDGKTATVAASGLRELGHVALRFDDNA